MRQIGLNILPRISYKPENFIVHSGVKEIVDYAVSAFSGGSFELLFVEGRPRSGKTHLAVRLTGEASAAGLFPRLLDGKGLREWLLCMPHGSACAVGSESVLIVDNADSYFSSVYPGLSGPFVNLIERIRAAGGKIVFLSQSPLSKFPCDEHVLSRLIPGSGYVIEPPRGEELGALLQVLGRQRGIALKQRSIDFILRRIERDIAGMESHLERMDHLSRVLGRSLKFNLVREAV